jgi:hypothetical protein
MLRTAAAVKMPVKMDWSATKELVFALSRINYPKLVGSATEPIPQIVPLVNFWTRNTKSAARLDRRGAKPGTHAKSPAGSVKQGMPSTARLDSAVPSASFPITLAYALVVCTSKQTGLAPTFRL